MNHEGGATWSRLAPVHYTDERVLTDERARVFAQAWQPIARLEQLQNDRDFVCAEVAGESVVVQNFKGRLRAFANVCSHRQSPLRTCQQGNGPLQCPYHGWTYDEAGQVAGIPQRRAFGDLPASLLASLALDGWALETLGPLVFAAKKPEQSLLGYLGPLADELVGRLARPLCMLANERIDVACNWKVMLENGLDAYHVPLVHADSIHKHGLSERAREPHGVHSSSRFVAASGTRVLRALRYAYPGASISDQYLHYLLFPNTYVVSVYDLFLVVTRFEPKRADRSELECSVFVTYQGTEGNAALREELNTSNARFFLNGYREDKQICEHVQRALEHTKRRALFSSEEERIPMFHQAWLERMASALNRETEHDS